jgi:glycosyltransferase involved in cell wall biosynthesis
MFMLIQIPCFNEEETLGETLAALPRSLPGITRIERLVIDDGSSDRTVEVAKEHGVEHVVRHMGNKGLARAFMSGLKYGISIGADIIVNTDADNQYCADDMGALVAPIVDGKADMVVGARPVDFIAHFSPMKRRLQRFGSWVVRKVSGADVQDAPSGFRAFSRETAKRMQVYNNYTYTLETLIQSGIQNLTVVSSPVRINPPTRPSRLIKSNLSYVIRSATTIIRVYILYKPLQFFMQLAALIAFPGLLSMLRFLLLWVGGDGVGHIQSLVLGGALLILGGLLAVAGILADIMSVNRRLLEEIRFRQFDR